jgi:hypothetical protein
MPHPGNELRLPVMQRVVFEMSDQHHQNLNCRHQNHHRTDPARGGTFLPQSCQGAVVLFAKTGGATRAAARSASCRRRRTIRAALPKAPAVGQEAREIQPRFASKDSPPSTPLLQWANLSRGAQPSAPPPEQGWAWAVRWPGTINSRSRPLCSAPPSCVFSSLRKGSPPLILHVKLVH